jgi:hypothetical protein
MYKIVAVIEHTRGLPSKKKKKKVFDHRSKSDVCGSEALFPLSIWTESPPSELPTSAQEQQAQSGFETGRRRGVTSTARYRDSVCRGERECVSDACERAADRGRPMSGRGEVWVRPSEGEDEGEGDRTSRLGHKRALDSTLDNKRGC